MELKPTAPAPLAERPPELSASKRPIWKDPRWLVSGIVALLLLVVIVSAGWFIWQLRPVDTRDSTRERLTVAVGMSPDAIAHLLKQKDLIRNTAVFDIYARLRGVRSNLQAGVYSLSASESLPDIVAHLTGGKTDTFTVTFFPGATLTDTTQTKTDKKVDITDVLLRAGYSQAEISMALAKTYDSPLFAGKPAGTNLEGYIYGETYQFSSGATVETILARTFAEFYGQIEQHNIITGLQKQGLNLYQGIVLASIIQREVSSSDPSQASADQRQVAQVFYARLAQNIPLGSDVTAYYGADKIGAARSVAVDTPYNTRIHTGLPPGPIAVPSIGALEAAANPAAGDYLYFLTGDDGTMYFAHTNEEHEQNITNHCKILCQMP